jgi:hypothetical protein
MTPTAPAASTSTALPASRTALRRDRPSREMNGTTLMLNTRRLRPSTAANT